MTPKTDTPEPIKQLDVKHLTDGQMGLIESLKKCKAEMESRLTGKIVTVTILDVDEDNRVYAINPAGNMEYPFIKELMNVREVTP